MIQPARSPQKALLTLVLSSLMVAACSAAPPTTPVSTASPTPSSPASPPVQAASALPQTPKTQAPRPSARVGFGLTYDAARQQTILFGGADSTGLKRDTWAWDGNQWHELNPPTSPAETLDLGYDQVRQLVVGFGTTERLSESTSALPPGDTWTWDGSVWRQLHPQTSPPARRGGSLTFDTKRARLILYGGRARPNETLYDAWAWDGSNWSPMRSNPDDFESLPGDAAYFPAIDKVVLYHWGGGVLSDPAQRFMWTFDGSVWNKRLTGTAQMPTGGPLVYDDQLRLILLFGQRIDPSNKYGQSGAATWTFDGSAWQQTGDASGPQGRWYPLAVYDSGRRRVVLFGGYELVNDVPRQQNDVWEFDGHSWTLVG